MTQSESLLCPPCARPRLTATSSSLRSPASSPPLLSAATAPTCVDASPPTLRNLPSGSTQGRRSTAFLSPRPRAGRRRTESSVLRTPVPTADVARPPTPSTAPGSAADRPPIAFPSDEMRLALPTLEKPARLRGELSLVAGSAAHRQTPFKVGIDQFVGVQLGRVRRRSWAICEPWSCSVRRKPAPFRRGTCPRRPTAVRPCRTVRPPRTHSEDQGCRVLFPCELADTRGRLLM